MPKHRHCHCTDCQLRHIHKQLKRQGALMTDINADLTDINTKLDKVYTEVTSVTDDLKAQIAALEANQADPAIVEALKANADRLDQLNPDTTEEPGEEPEPEA